MLRTHELGDADKARRPRLGRGRTHRGRRQACRQPALAVGGGARAAVAHWSRPIASARARAGEPRPARAPRLELRPARSPPRPEPLLARDRAHPGGGAAGRGEPAARPAARRGDPAARAAERPASPAAGAEPGSRGSTGCASIRPVGRRSRASGPARGSAAAAAARSRGRGGSASHPGRDVHRRAAQGRRRQPTVPSAGSESLSPLAYLRLGPGGAAVAEPAAPRAAGELARLAAALLTAHLERELRTMPAPAAARVRPR